MKYSVKALLVYLAVMAVAVILQEYTSVEFNAIHISFLGLFMFGTSSLVHYMTMKASEENPRRFPTYFMAITGLKMAVYVVFLGVYVFIFKQAAIPVVIAFLVFYAIYTVMEVLSALSALKSKD